MCCPLDQVDGRLVIQNAGFDDSNNNLHLRGIYERTPKTLPDRIFRFFQRLELIEKISEVADESFHLFGSLLQQTTSIVVYQTFRDLHHAAHTIEHLMHAVCFIGDLSRALTGRFFEYYDAEQKKPDYLRSAARLIHAVSHFLASVRFLADHHLVKANRFEHLLKYTHVLSAMGYAIWAATLIWRRYYSNTNAESDASKSDQFAADFGIHLGGFLFEAIPLAQEVPALEPYTTILSKLSAIAGIVHAGLVVKQLIPQDVEKIETHFQLPHQITVYLHEKDPTDAEDTHHCEHSPHDEDHDHDHDHSVQFHPVAAQAMGG